MTMNKYIYCLLIFFGFSLSACANPVNGVEETISEFLEEISGCEVDVSIEKSISVSDTGNDYSSMVPRILPSDIQVIAYVKMCGTHEKYYFWVRREQSIYRVISYTSFSQPE